MPDKFQTLKCCFALIVEVNSVNSTLEATEGSEATIEDLDLLDCGRGFHLQYGGYMIGVGPDSPRSDQILEELSRSYSEGTLFGVDLHIEFSKTSERFP